MIDDCIVTDRGDHLMVVVNASRRTTDLAHLRHHLTADVDVVERTDTALLALQGPAAVTVLARFAPAIADLRFLHFAEFDLVDGTDRIAAGVGVSRSGYTGEDGFELLVAAADAEAVARRLLDHPEVHPAGLGARDTLRLEAGLALYGNDLDETTSPVEADLVWTMPKRRREDARFLGAERILAEHRDGPTRRRVGLRALGRRPVRDGTELRTTDGAAAGSVTSGGYGPTVGGPVAMGYVAAELAVDGQALIADVRGNDTDVVVVPLPFTPHNYQRGS